MENYIEIRAIELNSDQKEKFKRICNWAYPLHTITFEEYGIVCLLKDNWSDPESFRINWLELSILHLYPRLLYKSYVSYNLKSLGSEYINRDNIKSVGDHIVNTLHANLQYILKK